MKFEVAELRTDKDVLEGMTTGDTARECCDACGREMTPEDYDAIHGTVLVSVTGKLGEVVIHGDSWTLLCPECYEAFRESWRDFKHWRKNSLWEAGGPEDAQCMHTPAPCRFRPCTAVQGVWCCLECEYSKGCTAPCPIATAKKGGANAQRVE